MDAVPHSVPPAEPDEPSSVLVVGGGIGGLTAALALHHVGVPVRVFERAPELHEVGAGLGLWANALRVLDQLGVGEGVQRIGTPLRVLEACSSSGEVLGRLDMREIVPDADVANYIIHRADLQRALAEQVPDDLLVTDAECMGVEQDEGGVTVHFRDRDPERASLVIGADGIHSVVRTALWGPDELRYSGQTCYRGIADFTPADPHVLREVQGAGQRASVCPIGQGRVYWWAARNAPAGEQDDSEARQDVLLKHFAGWSFGIPQAIAATTGPVLRNDLVDRAPLKRWGRGRVTLLGDAAHPMLPNLGQGACTAIEDGLVLARAVAERGLTPDALQAYERERIGRTTAVVAQSWRFGVPVRWEHPAAVWVREQLARWMPDALLARMMRKHIGYDVGALPAHEAS